MPTRRTLLATQTAVAAISIARGETPERAEPSFARTRRPEAHDNGKVAQVGTEHELSRARLVEVFRQTPAFIATLRGPDHIFEAANPAFSELAGHRRLVGRPAREVFPDPEGERFLAVLDQVYETGEALSASEQPISLGGGTGAGTAPHFLHFAYQPLTSSDGGVTGILIHGIDVTDLVHAHRQAEEQAEELQNQAAQLEEIQAELEASNDELLRASQEAEDARARLEAVLRQMPSGVVVVEAGTGRVLLQNERMDRIWRKSLPSASDGKGVRHYAGFHPDGRPYEPEEWPLERSLRGERVMNEEVEIIRGDGTRGAVSMNSAPIQDLTGTVIAAVAVFEDITEQREHEQELAFLVEAARLLASSLDYRQTLRSVARLAVPRFADWCAVDVLEHGQTHRVAVVHSDPAKEELAYAMARHWPEAPDAAMGIPRVLRTGKPEQYTRITDEVVRAFAESEEHLRALREVGMRSVLILPMVARGRTLGAITLIFAESGREYGENELRLAEKLASRAATAVDNAWLYHLAEQAREEAEQTQRRAEDARRSAEAANRSKSEFLANMSHEIRTPLNAVTGYTELLELEIAGPLTGEQRSYLERIRASTAHLLGLINDVLDLARVESGRLEVQHEPARVADGVASALALVGPQATERGIELHDHCSTRTELSYVGDEHRVRQILINVIGNAVKFTSPGGRVVVSCGTAEEAAPGARLAELGPWTYIEVRDTGIGIPADQVERIFRPFEQAQGGYTREAGGTGLGLAISRQLALLMGGDITLVSTPGEGSTFTVWLPTEVPFEEAVLPDIGDEDHPPGLREAGDVLLREVESILVRYDQRLREDPRVPMAAGLDQTELEDHHSSLLSDIASALVILARPSEVQEQLLRDSAEIQRVVADLHGRQRAQLSWTEDALNREFQILGEEIRGALEASLPAGASGHEAAMQVIRWHLERTRKISIRAFRVATSGTRHPPA